MTEEKAIVDVTKYIVQANNVLLDIKTWLIDNVGPATDPESRTCRKGQGWEIAYKSEMEGDNYKYRIVVEFARDDEAVMFKLVWP